MKRLKLVLTVSLVLSSFEVVAGDKPLLLGRITGVYRSPVVIQNPVDGVVRTENILEIVKYGSSTAYISTRLNHPVSGNLCSLWGIAEIDGPGLIYRSATEGTGPACTLRLTFDGTSISFQDEGGECRKGRCGANTSFSQFSLDRSKRRPMSNLSQVRKSRHYREAAGEYERVRRRASSTGRPGRP